MPTRARRRALAAVMALLATPSFLRAQETNAWRLVLADDLDRPTIGANWRWAFPGSGRMYILDRAVHISHDCGLRCVVPLPDGEVRVELDLVLPNGSFRGTNSLHAVRVAMCDGEPGAGGNHESG